MGLRGQNDIVQLNLHEKAHGPHGLVAGTTGSGKSEIIQSYILSLAVNFHPHDVAFLLIDYKGGGMANLFRDLPHLLGTITNLDGAQSMRALTSIKAELKRRQRLFSEYDVNHINQYQKKYKLGEVPEPMPHLFLISDEFAELKQNQPDFMAELVSTARIGRSLGIHLILATQKPSGVVNDQIWSNSRFKLALKVADRADSQEMLRTPDAADITQSGRAYLQVGNNEVYELFQSAWSGAEYQPEKDKQGIEDHTIYAINDLGQYEILNDDLSGLEETEDIKQVPTELDAIVGYIHDLVVEEGIPALPQPWLPPLEEKIYLEDIAPVMYEAAWNTIDRQDMILHLGIGDFPEQQAQETVEINLTNDGHILLYGSVGTGKTTFLQSAVMDLARHHSPARLNFYLLDFGTNALFPLRKLPHVADFLTADQEEKLGKFMVLLKAEMAKRKKLFAQHDVNSKAMYEEMTGKSLPQIVVIIDNYEGHKEIQNANLRTDMDNFFLTLSRDGFSFGISIIATGNRSIAIRGAILSNFRSRMVLKLTDDGDVRNLIGARPAYAMEEIQGRGVMRYGDEIEVVQVFLSNKGTDDIQRLHELQEEITAMADSWDGPKPRAIPIMPEQISFEAFRDMDTVQDATKAGRLTLGITYADVEAFSLELSRFKHLLYTSDRVANLQNMTKHLIRSVNLVNPSRLMVLDTEEAYIDYKPYCTDYYGQDAEMETVYVEIITEIYRRMDSVTEDEKTWFVIIPNMEKFATQTKLNGEQLNFVLDKAPKVGIYFFFGGMSSYLINGISDVAKAMRNNVQYFLFGMRMMDQAILPKVFNSKEPYPEPDVAYLHDRKAERLMKLSDLQESEG